MNTNKNMLTIEFLPRVKKDFFTIQKYTRKRYGPKQVTKYIDLLHKKVEKIRDNPSIGKQRRDIPPGYLAYKAGKHYIIYKVDKSKLLVITILHESMDFTQRLS